jgi:hypothetical protein
MSQPEHIARIVARVDARAMRERARASSLRYWSDEELQLWLKAFRGVELRGRNCLIRIRARRKRTRIDAEIARRRSERLRLEG